VVPNARNQPVPKREIVQSAEQAVQVGDDRLGRAFDQLFDADRGALLTELVVTIGKAFAVDFAQLHNDSTSVRFCGQYRNPIACGRPVD
jgi:hypothetical protein